MVRRGGYTKEKFRPRARGRWIDKAIILRKLHTLTLLGVTALVVWGLSARPWVVDAEWREAPWQAPEFTHSADSDWINSRPLTLADLRGRVVLVDFWTYGCWNCKRSLPWVKEVALEDLGGWV